MTVPVHSLKDQHRALLKAHFAALADEDVHLRFGSTINLDARDAYVDSLQFERDTIFGVYADDLSLLGVAHLACLGCSAELGVSVLAGCRGHGIGTALFNRAIIRARNLQVNELNMNCLAQNGAIMHIARKAGMQIVIEHSGADAFLRLPPGNPLTFGQEVAEQELALYDWTLKANVGALKRLTGS